MDSRAARHAGARFRDRLHHDAGFGDAEPRAAIFLGNADAEPAVLGDRLMKIEREAAFSVALQPIFIVEAAADSGDGLADGFLFGGEREIHVLPPGRHTDGGSWGRSGAAAMTFSAESLRISSAE